MSVTKRALVVGGVTSATIFMSLTAGAGSDERSFPVAGTGVHYFSSAIIHQQDQTPGGMLQRSTDIVKLSGSLEGYVLYHAHSTFDFTANTLVTTGTQVFSGTVEGSAPVVLHDDRFRFDVDLTTGAVSGTVHFGRSKDAPDQGRWFECDLTVIGTGLTPEGDGMVDYEGVCTAKGSWPARAGVA